MDIVEHGSGTTNRRFFGNPSSTAQITEIDETQIKRNSADTAQIAVP